MTEVTQIETDVLVIGSGAAGMYAAIEAARLGCRVHLLDAVAAPLRGRAGMHPRAGFLGRRLGAQGRQDHLGVRAGP